MFDYDRIAPFQAQLYFVNSRRTTWFVRSLVNPLLTFTSMVFLLIRLLNVTYSMRFSLLSWNHALLIAQMHAPYYTGTNQVAKVSLYSVKGMLIVAALY